jgi:hypothetical protein
MTGTIPPPTDALHVPSYLAQEDIYFLYYTINTNFVTRLLVAYTGDGLIGNGVESRIFATLAISTGMQ